jgi:hypothetical protein
MGNDERTNGMNWWLTLLWRLLPKMDTREMIAQWHLRLATLVFLLGLVSLIWMLLLLGLMQKALVIHVPSKSLRSGTTTGKKRDNGWGNEPDELSEGPERQDKALGAPTSFPPWPIHTGRLIWTATTPKVAKIR